MGSATGAVVLSVAVASGKLGVPWETPVVCTYMLPSVPASAVVLVSGAGRSPLELTAVGVDSIDSVTVTVDVISLSKRVVYTVVTVFANPRSVKNWRRQYIHIVAADIYSRWAGSCRSRSQWYQCKPGKNMHY